MWLITVFGFFSIVEKQHQARTGMLTIRSRVKQDLETLRAKYLPNLGEITTDDGTDYPYRAVASRSDVAKAFHQALLDINYANFKETIARHQGSTREKIYSDVWHALHTLHECESEMTRTGDASLSDPYLTPCSDYYEYGAVLVNDQHQFLLIQPAEHVRDTQWTFPRRGREEADKTIADVVLREVLARTGYTAEFSALISGCWPGETRPAIYYLLRPLLSVQKPHWRTRTVRWASADEARQLISQTTQSDPRQRDLDILEAAQRAASPQHRK